MSKPALIIPSLFVSIALVLAAYIVASEVRKIKEADQVIKVVGSAKQELISDFGILQATLSGSGQSTSTALQSLKNQKEPLLEFLSQKGFPESKVSFEPPFENHLFEYDQNGRYTGEVIRYSYSQRFTVESTKVSTIQELSLELIGLVEQGVSVKVQPPQYFYQDLAEVKIAVQSLAAADAKARAVKIAKATDTKLGPIRGARMGVLQITPKNSNTVSDYGINDTTSIEKEITAVVSAEFQVR